MVSPLSAFSFQSLQKAQAAHHHHPWLHSISTAKQFWCYCVCLLGSNGEHTISCKRKKGGWSLPGWWALFGCYLCTWFFCFPTGLWKVLGAAQGYIRLRFLNLLCWLAIQGGCALGCIWIYKLQNKPSSWAGSASAFALGKAWPALSHQSMHNSKE